MWALVVAFLDVDTALRRFCPGACCEASAFCLLRYYRSKSARLNSRNWSSVKMCARRSWSSSLVLSLVDVVKLLLVSREQSSHLSLTSLVHPCFSAFPPRKATGLANAG